MKDHEYTIGKANEVVVRANEKISRRLFEDWITSSDEDNAEKLTEMTRELARQRTLNVPDEEEKWIQEVNSSRTALLARQLFLGFSHS